MKKVFNEGNQIHIFMSSSGSGTVINYGSGSDFLPSYGSGSTSQKVTVPTVPVPVPQHCTWGTRHFRGGGGGLGCHLAGFPPTQGNIVFCLDLLNYMTSCLFSWCYILLLTQRFFWCKCNHRVMATFSCVAQKAASAAGTYIIILESSTSLAAAS